MNQFSINVLIHVNGLVNRGDQLMLEACYEQVKKHFPNAKIAVPARVFKEGLDWCDKRSILPLGPVRIGKKALFKELLFKLFQRLTKRQLRLYSSQIDLVLAAPGFHYGDAFEHVYSPKMVDDEIRQFRSFSKKGCRIVLLPQAFGPFKKPLSRRLFQGILSQANVLYARDNISYNNVLEVFPDVKNQLKIAPDFTCLCHGNSPIVEFPRKTTIVVIPNIRMTEQTDSAVSTSYAAFMASICKGLNERGEHVILLNHEGIADDKIIRVINEQNGNRFPVLSGLNGLDCKAVIGNAKLVISSRYHGVVSGLTQGVPTLCTSWSHKYSELLAEHGCPNNILAVEDLAGSFAKIVDALNHPDRYASAANNNHVIANTVAEMWDAIFSAIDRKQ